MIQVWAGLPTNDITTQNPRCMFKFNKRRIIHLGLYIFAFAASRDLTIPKPWPSGRTSESPKEEREARRRCKYYKIFWALLSYLRVIVIDLLFVFFEMMMSVLILSPRRIGMTSRLPPTSLTEMSERHLFLELRVPR